MLRERVIPCVCTQTCNTTDAGNLLSSSSQQPLPPQGEKWGTRAGTRLHEHQVKNERNQGEPCALQLDASYRSSTPNTAISFPANTFPLDAVSSKPRPEAQATQRTPGLAQLAPQSASPQAIAEGLKGFAYGSHCSSFYPGHAQQAKESWRRWGEGSRGGRGLNLREAGN